MKVGFVGGAGVGKSTVSSGVFYNMKKMGYLVEYVPEVIKYSVFNEENFNKVGFQTKKTLEQMELEQKFDKGFQNRVLDYIICEAPIFVGYIYGMFYDNKLELNLLKHLALNNVNSYDILYIIEHDDNNNYNGKARNETKDDSLKVEHLIKDFIVDNYKGLLFNINRNKDINKIVSSIIKFKGTI